ncbi:MAG TPA: hypothetical protein VKP30_25420 [Polyangiaceae bacterium]|nr:hypothetical protein [Polyangiaceae bacterium]
MMPNNSSERSLTIRSNIVQLRLTAELAGYLDSETLSNLGELLELATTDVSAGIVRDFEFNVSQIYLMSSSAISCLASWVKSMNERFPASKIFFRTSQELTWQRRALAPIRRLAPQSVFVD